MSSTMINKDEAKETFYIDVKVRDKEGNIYKNENDIKVPSIGFEISVFTWEQLEFQMKTLCRQFKSITPKGSSVDLTASIFNGIGDSWMNMASYYGSEKRFVKH